MFEEIKTTQRLAQENSSKEKKKTEKMIGSTKTTNRGEHDTYIRHPLNRRRGHRERRGEKLAQSKVGRRLKSATSDKSGDRREGLKRLK